MNDLVNKKLFYLIVAFCCLFYAPFLYVVTDMTIRYEARRIINYYNNQTHTNFFEKM